MHVVRLGLLVGPFLFFSAISPPAHATLVEVSWFADGGGSIPAVATGSFGEFDIATGTETFPLPASGLTADFVSDQFSGSLELFSNSGVSFRFISLSSRELVPDPPPTLGLAYGDPASLVFSIVPQVLGPDLASARLFGATVSEGPLQYRFTIVPEPTTAGLLLLGLTLAGVLRGPRRRNSSHMLAAGALILGCATRIDNLPYCEAASSLPPSAASECRARADVNAFAHELFDLLEDDLGPVVVRVSFGPGSRVHAVCTERTSLPGSWEARSAISSDVEALMSLPPGPSCLAGTRLDFNELGAQRAQAQQMVEECERQAHARFEADESFGSYSQHAATVAARGLRRCIDSQQDRLGQVWFFDHTGEIHSAFRRSDDSLDRDEAVRRCSAHRVPVDLSTYDVAIGSAHRGSGLVGCMQSLGWELLY